MATNTTETTARTAGEAAYRVASWLRHAPDRLLHPLHRALARRRLRRSGPAQRVLFVCLGNICRSPYAAAAFDRLTGGAGAPESAGLIGPGRPPPQNALDVAAARGIDLSAHRSQLVTEPAVRAADLVIVMDLPQARALQRLGVDRRKLLLLGDLDPEPIEKRIIRDPFDQDAAVFTTSYDRIDRCLRALADQLELNRRPAGTQPRPDRADPSQERDR